MNTSGNLVVTDELIEKLISSLNPKGSLELFCGCIVYRKHEEKDVEYYEYLLLRWDTEYLFPDVHVCIPLRPKPYRKLSGGVNVLRSKLRTFLSRDIFLSVGELTLKDDQVTYDEERDVRSHFYTFAAQFLKWKEEPEKIVGLENYKWVTCIEAIESTTLGPWIVSAIQDMDAELIRNDTARKKVRKTTS